MTSSQDANWATRSAQLSMIKVVGTELVTAQNMTVKDLGARRNPWHSGTGVAPLHMAVLPCNELFYTPFVL